jgi:hypothetical protein
MTAPSRAGERCERAGPFAPYRPDVYAAIIARGERPRSELAAYGTLQPSVADKEGGHPVASRLTQASTQTILVVFTTADGRRDRYGHL